MKPCSNCKRPSCGDILTSKDELEKTFKSV